MAMTVSKEGGGSVSGMPSAREKAERSNSTARRPQYARPKNQKKPKKKLNYNPREISSQLVRAKRAQSASVVLVRAKSKVRSLQLSLASGNYNMNEIRTALAHANKMVNCARMKVRNLKEEEQTKRQDDKKHGTKEQQRKQEVKRRVHKKEQELKVQMAMEESRQLRSERADRIELQQKRQKNRNRELGAITKANMEYLQDRTKDQQRQDSAAHESVILELSQTATQLSELKMAEQQLEQQVEMEVAMEMEGMVASAVSAAVSGGVSGGAVSAEGAPAVSLDVCV